MIFSFSRLNVYAECPFRFFCKYVLELPESVTLPLALGKAAHKTIELKIKGMEHDEAVRQGWIESDFHPEVTFNEIDYLSKRAKIYVGMGDTEVHFNLPLSNEPNAPVLQGYIDLVAKDGTFFTDWKTNRKMYDVMDTRQIPLYAWAVDTIYNPKQAILGTLYFLRFKKASSRLFDKVDMEFARLWALNLANEINFKLKQYQMNPTQSIHLFPAKPSNKCSYCPFAYQCTIANSKYA